MINIEIKRHSWNYFLNCIVMEAESSALVENQGKTYIHLWVKYYYIDKNGLSGSKRMMVL